MFDTHINNLVHKPSYEPHESSWIDGEALGMVILTCFALHDNQSHEQDVLRFDGNLPASAIVPVADNSTMEYVVQFAELGWSEVIILTTASDPPEL